MTRARPSSQAAALPPLPSTAQLATLCTLLEARTGLTISDAKRTLVGARLAPRLRALALPSLDAYCRVLERSDAELAHLIDLVTTHETSFFRQPHHFAFLEGQLVPHWRDEARRRVRPHQVRVWSAGCSTGEEPYSIAMALYRGLPSAEGWTVQVLATDISEPALARARAGVFTEERSRGLPETYRSAYLRPCAGPPGSSGSPCTRKVDPDVARLLTFQRINLLDEVYPAPRDFDVVFCRNVLIYMRPDAQRRVVGRLFAHLADGGHLLLGQAEALLGVSGVRRVAPTIYRALPSGAPSHRPAALVGPAAPPARR